MIVLRTSLGGWGSKRSLAGIRDGGVGRGGLVGREGMVSMLGGTMCRSERGKKRDNLSARSAAYVKVAGKSRVEHVALSRPFPHFHVPDNAIWMS